jgi:hypothetical protein
MMVVESGNRFWSNVTSIPFDQAELDPDTHDLGIARDVLQTAAIRHAGDHHRNTASRQLYGQQSDSQVRINLPGALAKSAVQLGKLRESSIMGTPYVIPTALDNMDSSNRFIHQGALVVADRSRRARAFDSSGERQRAG